MPLLAMEHNRLQTYIQPSNGTYARFTPLLKDLAWGWHWYLPQPIVRGEAQEFYLVRWLRQVGLSLLLDFTRCITLQTSESLVLFPCAV